MWEETNTEILEATFSRYAFVNEFTQGNYRRRVKLTAPFTLKNGEKVIVTRKVCTYVKNRWMFERGKWVSILYKMDNPKKIKLKYNILKKYYHILYISFVYNYYIHSTFSKTLYKIGGYIMNKKLRILMEITPPLSIFFILIGVTLGVLGALDHNIKTITGSLFIIAQAALAIIYTKTFKKIWGQ